MWLQEVWQCGDLIRARLRQTSERLQQKRGRGLTAQPAKHFISQQTLPALRFIEQATESRRSGQEEQQDVQAALHLAALGGVRGDEALQRGVEAFGLRAVDQQQQQAVGPRQLHRQLHRRLTCVRHMRAATRAFQVVPPSTLRVAVLQSIQHQAEDRHAIVSDRYGQVL